MTTIKIPIPESADLNRDGKVTLGERIVSAVALILFLWVLFLVIIAGICRLFRLRLSLDAALGALMIAIFLGCAVAIWRLIVYEKEEWLARTDRKMRRDREQWEFDVLKGETEAPEESPPWNQYLQDKYARMWLDLSYKQGKPITRDQWQDMGLPPTIWNRINRLMNDYKIRKGSTLVPEDFGSAWGVWLDGQAHDKRWSTVELTKG